MSKLQFNLIKEMTANYRKNQLVSIEKSSTNPIKNDAHSIWLSIETIKSLITDIEKNVAINKPGNTSPIGLRFYYAAYPDKTKWGKPGYEDLTTVPTSYAKLHTLIAVPTIAVSGVTRDFNPSDPTTYQGFPTNYAGKTTIAENHGQLFPPENPNGETF